MGTTHKILEDFYDETFVLIALHSSIEDHMMAFSLNATLKTRFKRSKKDLNLVNDVSFPMFEWLDEKTDSYWSLFPNSGLGQKGSKDTGLFRHESSFTKYYLVPERKEVDFFIKVDQEIDDTVLADIQRMPQVITAYMVDCETLNSKNNLIF